MWFAFIVLRSWRVSLCGLRAGSAWMDGTTTLLEDMQDDTMQPADCTADAGAGCSAACLAEVDSEKDSFQLEFQLLPPCSFSERSQQQRSCTALQGTHIVHPSDCCTQSDCLRLETHLFAVHGHISPAGSSFPLLSLHSPPSCHTTLPAAQPPRLPCCPPPQAACLLKQVDQ